jgi:hypothetical protein
MTKIEFTLVLFWESSDAIRRWAGDEPDLAVLYPEDECYFTRFELSVEHLRVANLPMPEESNPPLLPRALG